MKACVPGDDKCYEDCVAAAPLDAQLEYNALAECLDEQGYFDCTPGDLDCQEAAIAECKKQYYDCFGGDLTCVEMYLCLADCPPGAEGDSCVQACFLEGSQEAIAKWEVFTACLEAAGYLECAQDDSDCTDAAWDACGDDFKECAHGKLNCTEIMECLAACEAGDGLCSLTCLVSGSVKGQNSYEAILDCVAAQCGENPTHECEQKALNGECADEYDKCAG